MAVMERGENKWVAKGYFYGQGVSYDGERGARKLGKCAWMPWRCTCSIRRQVGPRKPVQLESTGLGGKERRAWVMSGLFPA